MKKSAAYGSWPSDISASLMVSAQIGLSETRLFQGEIYWLESRPQEQGRTAIVKLCKSDERHELLPLKYSCRSRVHEYGGASYVPTSEGVFFVNESDQQIVKINLAQEATSLTDAEDYRFVDLSFNEKNSTLLAIAERHSASGGEPENSLVSIDINDGSIVTLHSGQDFYASASLSPDGSKICFLSWMHPNMPWDGTMLWQGDFDVDNLTIDANVVAGGSEESIVQPEWSPAGELYFVSDRSDWWNLYCLSDQRVSALCPMEAEFGSPQWQFGATRYGFLDDTTILCTYSQSGLEYLAELDVQSGQLTALQRSHSNYHSLRTEAGKYCFVAQSMVKFPSVYVGDSDNEIEMCASSEITLDANHVSKAQSVTFPSGDGELAHGFYYPPTHAEYQGMKDELPPLLIMIHGGPTSATSAGLSLKIQYWTNKGFAVLDVNYRGSTGFGRPYRDALKLNWGVCDVQDCDFGVRYLIEKGLADKNRVAIRGGSAGGFTTLAALALTDTFKAGTSLYGVSDLTALASDTHKFESRYLDSLIGAYPQEKEIYLQRSPVTHASSITSPVLFLQGKDDKVVPPSQAEMMIESLTSNGVPVAYLSFAGEAHGFRKSENIIKAFEAELWFYGSVFGFTPDDDLEPLEFIAS